MAITAKQSAVLIDSLITDLVDNAIEQSQTIKAAGPCQKLFDALGLLPCTIEDDADSDNETNVERVKKVGFKGVDDTATPTPSFIDPPSSSSQTDEKIHLWYSWLDQELLADRSDDDTDIYPKKYSESGCQTEQPRSRSRKRFYGVRTIGDRPFRDLAPCERTRQTVFIDAQTAPTPNLQNRPPLGDRFCYMLTDFASALYCSLAIMCCCTPSMFR